MIQMGEIVPLGNSRTLKFGHSMNIIFIFGHSGNRTLKFIVFLSGSDHGWLNYFHNVTFSVYSPFSDRVGLPLHNTPFPGVTYLCYCGCSAASNWKPGPHAVSTIVKCLQSPGCC